MTDPEGAPDPSRPPQTHTAPRAPMRRLTITIPGDEAEAVQFSNGVISGLWSAPTQLYLWRDLDALLEQWPDAEITWIDPEEADRA